MYFYCNYLISRLCYETQGRQGGGERGKQEVWLYSAVTKCKTSAFRLRLDPFSVTIKKKTKQQNKCRPNWLDFPSVAIKHRLYSDVCMPEPLGKE